jgi:hypothetical protein
MESRGSNKAPIAAALPTQRHCQRSGVERPRYDFTSPYVGWIWREQKFSMIERDFDFHHLPPNIRLSVRALALTRNYKEQRNTQDL